LVHKFVLYRTANFINPMQCPGCSTKLERKLIGHVETDACQNCAGIWFQLGELCKAKDELIPDLNWMDSKLQPTSQEILKDWECFTSRFDWLRMDYHPVSDLNALRNLTCPECRQEMKKLLYTGTRVEMDVCRKCQGVWLAGGEFQQIISELRETANNMSPEDYKNEVLSEIRDIFSGEESIAAECRDLTMLIRIIKRKFVDKN
jgi:Zn-finger nucleic acid-binding protein